MGSLKCQLELSLDMEDSDGDERDAFLSEYIDDDEELEEFEEAEIERVWIAAICGVEFVNAW